MRAIAAALTAFAATRAISVTVGITASALLSAPSALAHESEDSLVTVHAAPTGPVSGTWQIPLGDLEDLWSERAATPAARLGVAARYQDLIVRAVSDDLGVVTPAGGSCSLHYHYSGSQLHEGRPYVVLDFAGACPSPPLVSVELTWTFLDAAEHPHRALVDFTSPGGVETTVLSRTNPVVRLGLLEPDLFAQGRQYFALGVHHIWTGADHLLFLLVLILPAVLATPRRPTASEEFRAAAKDLACTVSAFTVAHSLTLGLVAFHLLHIAPRAAGIAVAASVAFAALFNLWPRLSRARWQLALGFGLIHGVGFGSVLLDLNLPLKALILSLIGFNVGVEAGQLAVIAVAIPAAFLVRRTPAYRYVVIGGSLAAIGIAGLWIVSAIR